MTTSTRRGILSAIAIAPMVIVAPAVASPVGTNRAAWNAAFFKWEQARKNWLALPDDASWETDTAASDRENAAWHVLISMPAPDVAALHWKLSFLFGGDGDGAWSREVTDYVVADAKRLSA
jgi:hypothetical protein